MNDYDGDAPSSREPAEPNDPRVDHRKNQKGASHPAVWVGTTYFAEGLPYEIVHKYAEVLFTEMGASLQTVGLTSLLHLPWNLKFLWGPFLDAYGTKRGWITGLQAAMLLCFVGLVGASTGSSNLTVLTLIFAAIAILSATQDIAIDAFYLEALREEDQAKWVGIRAPAYRAALLIGGPGLILADRLGFQSAFAAAAALMASLLFYHWAFLPHGEPARRPFLALLAPKPLAALVLALGVGLGIARLSSEENAAAVSTWAETNLPLIFSVVSRLGVSGAILVILLLVLLAALAALPWLKGRLRRADSFYGEAFISFLDKPKVGRILWFVLFFRTGESFLMKMKYPFFKSVGMSLETYAWASGTVGMVAALVAPAVGGWLIARDGLRRWIWPFVIAQNGFNLSYWALAAYLGDGTAFAGQYTTLMGAVITLEMFGAGLGTAVFMVYLMRCPLPGHRAAHMAILTALMSASFTLAGVVSGFLANALGFEQYFLLTVAAAVPGMVVIPFLPHLEEPTRSPGR